MDSRARETILAELTPPFLVHEPAAVAAPLVFSSPHSGSVYPDAFIKSSRLKPAQLRRSEDCFVDELFRGVTALGAPMIAARFPRAYLDVNREPYELDPDLFHEALPDYANTRSLRVAGGLGTIARVVSEGEEIYRDRLNVSDAFERISRCYRPYHECLLGLVDRTRRSFGVAVLIDCHSMPSANCGAQDSARPDFVLGDRFGTSCDPVLTRLMRDTLIDMGYDVAFNRPYAGGYITEHYGRPAIGAHAIQLEVNRALYMDEETFTRSTGFERLAVDLDGLTQVLAQRLRGMLAPRVAAE